ncbi:polyisoprenoid-binding protein [Lujinxingia litoralis]|uniref:Polyisoprenoid-binding protein n=1 Tax=Lujinxingia litoralis TaxID=2211119 RepID=A0A328CD10_9DELT|nr:YceI family protein [Lujinxingia litoralis]RAL23841.1 polyisoprenoid-binding protein [Lujinxingia litoralis]
MANATWNFDLSHSDIAFKVRHMMFAKVSGRFTNWTGTLEFDPENPGDATTSVSIETASIDTANNDRDNHLRSGDFFDAETFPTLEFKSTGFKTEGKKLLVEGNLTIRDQTHPVTLDAEFLGKVVDPWGNDRVGFSATTIINRKEFGLTWNQAMEAGGVLVGEKIEIEINVQAVKAG